MQRISLISNERKPNTFSVLILVDCSILIQSRQCFRLLSVLDIENKKFLTWHDVEFYLLVSPAVQKGEGFFIWASLISFHVTVAGKEGANGGDLEARLSRAARALWEHINDQVPSEDGKREKLSLEQFLDTWASLIDYIVKNGQLPTLVQDLVNLGFELYSNKGGDGKASSIPVSAFEQLFQKMNLGRPYAQMAYKFLTEVMATVCRRVLDLFI